MTDTLNVAARLSTMAAARPDAVAVVEPLGYDRQGKRIYRHLTFRELDQDSDRIARGLREWGVPRGTRLVMLIRPGVDFISTAFALFKAGMVSVLIDPGMGSRGLLRCLGEAEPEGFIAISKVQAVRALAIGRFPKARYNVTVGRRWFWGGPTLDRLRGGPWSGSEVATTQADDPAAIIFTTGSTGPAKGVLFSHRNFDAQVEQIQGFYGIQPGEIDLPGFPFFGLFNCAMGVTAVIPDMDPSRPAQVDPQKILEAVDDWKVTQMFGSPAIWNRVGRYCEEHSVQLPTVRRVLSAGAPVPEHVLRRMKNCIAPDGDIHTPYGATEALPVASIAASEVLSETIPMTRVGAGVCVGRRFAKVRWKVIRIVDGPIASIADVETLPPGEIGELIVQGPQVTREYVTRVAANRMAKIADPEGVWHRMGDSGYFDENERFWFCGRVAHRVLTAFGPFYPIRCEAIFNQHPEIHRSALVGVGPKGKQRPVIICEPYQPEVIRNRDSKIQLLRELRQLGLANPLTAGISDYLLHPGFPVDIRHNAKIFREKLSVWAAVRCWHR
jgi:acyl-CoA synthetase (AMP-forming)/AMP-acid ligase II